MPGEKRKRTRVDTGLEAVLNCGGIEKVPVRIVNLSLKGALCEHEPDLKRSRECVLNVTLGRDITFRVEAHVVRNDEHGLALDFEGMDEQAFFHLRNLVRYHSLNPDAIDKELASPAFTPKS